MFNPVNWSVVAGRAALHGQADWSIVLPRIGLLVGFTIVCGFLATRAFRSYQRSV
jgi:ABC-2 type transport system permease protein